MMLELDDIYKRLTFQRIHAKQMVVETPTLYMKEEFLQQVSHTKVAFDCC